LNRLVTAEGISKGLPRIDRILMQPKLFLMLAPETNGHVAVKAWGALSKITGRDHTASGIASPKMTKSASDIQANPRKIISSPTWTGLGIRTCLLQRLITTAGAITCAHRTPLMNCIIRRCSRHVRIPRTAPFGEENNLARLRPDIMKGDFVIFARQCQMRMIRR